MPLLHIHTYLELKSMHKAPGCVVDLDVDLDVEILPSSLSAEGGCWGIYLSTSRTCVPTSYSRCKYLSLKC